MTSTISHDELLYDPFDAGFQMDPYAGYRQLRDLDPVHFHPGDGTEDRPDFWALSRFTDIDEAVRNPEVFSSAHGLTMYADEIKALGLAPTIVMMDPPEHTHKRRLIAKAFSPRRVAATEETLRDFVRAKLQKLSARAADGETVDLHRDYSTTIPTFVVSRLLGVPAEEQHRFDPWVSALTTIQDEGFTFSKLGSGAVAAVAEMFEYFGALIADRRAAIEAGGEPGDDLISALITSEIDDERLTDWDILGFCFVIVAGGNDTTGNLISHTAMLLDAHHDQREQIVAQPELIPNALTECLRLESSVQSLARYTLSDVTIHDTTIPAGSKVMMIYASGNRDEREFGDNAAELDIHREIGRHLAFTQGPHFCIGSHFAKLQAKVAVEEMYAANPHLGVDLAGAVRIRSPFTRGFTSLPATGLVAPQNR